MRGLEAKDDQHPDGEDREGEPLIEAGKSPLPELANPLIEPGP